MLLFIFKLNFETKIQIRKFNLKIKIIEISSKIMSIGSSNPQMSSFMTLSTKRDALWNVVEPGDPYDIRK
jgi:hypothetical protein